MPNIITAGFASIDAGQGNGVVTVSTTYEIDGAIVDDVKNGVQRDYWGAARQTELPGVINAARHTGNYVPAATSTQLYLDLIASYDDSTQVTLVIRDATGAKSSTNHEITITGLLAKGPLSGMMHGEDIRFPVDVMVDQVTHDDATTVYTW